MRRATATPAPIGKPGRVISAEPLGELDHYFECSECGWMIEMRNLGEVLEHEGPHERPVSQ